MYLFEAGKKALRNFDNETAILHLTHGLTLLKELPETHSRNQQELDFQLALGVPLVLVRGHGTFEVEATYTRALQLCQQIGDTPQLFQVLMGLRRFYLHQGDLLAARQTGEQMISLAINQQDQFALSRAWMMQEEVMYAMGEFTQACECCQQGRKLYDPQQASVHVLVYGNDTGIGLRMFCILVKWILGFPEQARAEAKRLVNRAVELRHPFSLVCALYWTALLYQLLGDIATVQEKAEEVFKISVERNFVLYRASALVLKGWVCSEQGRQDDGIALIQQGIAGQQAPGAAFIRMSELSILAEAFRKAGKIQNALAVLADADQAVVETQQRGWMAENLRIKGELLLLHDSKDTRQAEDCFQQALVIARDQQAKSWELRAALSLSRLWQQQDRMADAHHLLKGVYETFTEGFDTADLIEARGLLEQLQL